MAETLLASAGVDAYDGDVADAVLEHMHRSVQSVLADARDLALHRDAGAVTKADVLAAEDGAAAPEPRDAQLERARLVNELPIELPDGHGVRLPESGEGSLSNRGYVVEEKIAGK